MVLSQEQDLKDREFLLQSKEYTDKHITLLRQILNNNINSMDAVFKKIKDLDDTLRILKFDYEVLLEENKFLKAEIHTLKVNSKVKQSSLEGF